MLFPQKVVTLIFLSVLLLASSVFQEQVVQKQVAMSVPVELMVRSTGQSVRSARARRKMEERVRIGVSESQGNPLAANTAQVMSGISTVPDNNLHTSIEFQQAVNAAQVTIGASAGQGNSYDGIEPRQAVQAARVKDAVTSELGYLPNSAESHLQANPVQASAVDVDGLAATKQNEQLATHELQTGPANGAHKDPMDHQKSNDPAAIAEISSQPWPPSDPRYYNNSGTTTLTNGGTSPDPLAATTATTTSGCDEQLLGENDKDYRGCQDHSKSGRQCQQWSSQTPHRHNQDVEDKRAGLINNFCRNPDGEVTIWCYTTDPMKRWEECDPKGATAAEVCNENLVRNCPACSDAEKGSGYRGCQTQTRSGKECQQWSSQEPHTHDRLPETGKYLDKDLFKNYCRNPDGADTIWCYTTTASTRWERCDPKR